MVFLFILLCIIIVVAIIVFSKIRIEIINFKFSSQTKRHINQDYKIVIKLFALKFLPILKINLTKTKFEKMEIKQKISDIDFTALEKNISLDKELFQTIKKIDVLIKDIKLYIDIGTESAIITSFIVPVISTVIALILQRKMKKFENQIFIVNPVYKNQNLVNIDFSGIFDIKMSHIINIIYILIKKEKKGVKKYERSSNRGPYDYSYE